MSQYIPTQWEDLPSKKTPITAESLNNLEQAVYDNRTILLLIMPKFERRSTKSTPTILLPMETISMTFQAHDSANVRAGDFTMVGAKGLENTKCTISGMVRQDNTAEFFITSTDPNNTQTIPNMVTYIRVFAVD